jgi:subtilisin family serine protease
MRLLSHALLAGLMAAGAALAQSPSQDSRPADTTVIALDSRSEARLDAGERVRVIVQFDLPQIAFDGLDRETRDAMRMEAIDRQAHGVLQRVFAASPEAMVAGSSGAHHERTFRYTPAMVMTLSRAEIERLAQDGAVTRITSDGLDRPMLEETVPRIGADLAHATGFTGSGATIAVLDTGIHYEHPAFEGRIIDSACFSTTDPAIGSETTCLENRQTDTDDPVAASACSLNDSNACVHGTHVASIAAGAPGDHPTLGHYALTGVAPSAAIVPVQIFSYFDDTDICDGASSCIRSYFSDQVEALEWLYESRSSLNLAAINMSLGGETHSGACDDDIRADVIGRLLAANVATVIAAGNDGASTEVSAPGCITDAVTVTALSEQNQVVGNNGPQTDIAAPGTNITAAGNPGSGQLQITQSGTSMATPHVAGAIAILRQASSDATIADMLAAIDQAHEIEWHAPPQSWAVLHLDDALQLIRRPVVTRDGSDSTTITRFDGERYNGAPLVYRFTNTGGQAEPWRIHTTAYALEYAVAGAETIENIGRNWSYSGTLEPGESIAVTIRPTPDFQRLFEWFRFIGGGLVARQDIRMRIDYRPAHNDDFANAPLLIGETFSIADAVGGPTLESHETAEDGYSGTVWYRWRPNTANTIQLRSISPFYIYRGTERDGLTRIGVYEPANNDFLATVNVEADQEYFIQVYAHVFPGNLDHQFRFWTSTPNEMLPGRGPANARLLPYRSDTIVPGVLRVGYSPATPNDLFYAPRDDRQSWFRWVAPYSGAFVLSNQTRHSNSSSIPHITSFAVFERSDGASTHAADDNDNLLRLVAGIEIPVDIDSQETANPQWRLSATVEENQTYWIRIGHSHNDYGLGFSYGQADELASTLRTAILPESRAVRLGSEATAFLSVVNPRSQAITARNCRLESVIGDSVHSREANSMPFSYRETDAANRPFGEENPSFDLAPGLVKSFVFSFQPFAAERRVRQTIIPVCDNVLFGRTQFNDLPLFTLTTANAPISDIIPIAVTPTANGIIEVANGTARAFSIAAINNGDLAEEIDVQISWVDVRNFIDNTPSDYVFTAEICESDPSTAQCISPRGHVVSTVFDVGEIRTFSVFVRAEGLPPVFNPKDFRISVSFGDGDIQQTGGLRGTTSVAVRLLGDQ